MHMLTLAGRKAYCRRITPRLAKLLSSWLATDTAIWPATRMLLTAGDGRVPAGRHGQVAGDAGTNFPVRIHRRFSGG